MKIERMQLHVLQMPLKQLTAKRRRPGPLVLGKEFVNLDAMAAAREHIRGHHMAKGRAQQRLWDARVTVLRDRVERYSVAVRGIIGF